jgi:hypothetical protein
VFRFYPALVFFRGHRDFEVMFVEFPELTARGELEAAKSEAHRALQTHLDALEDHMCLPFPTSIEAMPFKVVAAEASGWCFIGVQTKLKSTPLEVPEDKEKKSEARSKGKKKKHRRTRSS